jgi:hypothetical protein
LISLFNSRQAVRSGWAVFVCLTDAPAVCDLAGTSYSGSPDLFLLICIPTLAVLSAWGMLLEKGTNALVNKLASLKNLRA